MEDKDEGGEEGETEEDAKPKDDLTDPKSVQLSLLDATGHLDYYDTLIAQTRL